jgi:aldose 1-epimerase
MALTGQQFTISVGDFAATAVEVGGGLRSFTYRGEDVTATYPETELPPKCCGGVLVPWPNRLRGGRYSFGGASYQLPISEPARGNAIHGLARWARWTAVAIGPASVTLAIDLVPQSAWPFEVRVEVTYALHPEFGLVVTARASNYGITPAPFGAGFHPYFSLRGQPLKDVTLMVPASRRLLLDEALVPVGVQDVTTTQYDLRSGPKLKALRLDDALTGLDVRDGRGAAEVRTKSGGARIWFDETFHYLQVFTAEDFRGGVPAVAIEPMTCPADAFNTGVGLIIIQPGGSWSGSWGITPLDR